MKEKTRLLIKRKWSPDNCMSRQWKLISDRLEIGTEKLQHRNGLCNGYYVSPLLPNVPYPSLIFKAEMLNFWVTMHCVSKDTISLCPEMLSGRPDSWHMLKSTSLHTWRHTLRRPHTSQLYATHTSHFCLRHVGLTHRETWWSSLVHGGDVLSLYLAFH